MENDVDIPTENLQEPTTYEVMNKEEVNTAKGEEEIVESLKVKLVSKHKENEALKETYLKRIGEITTEYNTRVMQAEEKLAATLKELEKASVKSETLNLKCASLQEQLDNCNSDMVTQQVVEPVYSPCEYNSCISDDDLNKLECSQCSRLVHYACTQLPTYQLSQFLTKGYRRYVCMQCTHIPDYVNDIAQSAKYVRLDNDTRETINDNQSIEENQTSTSSDQLQVYAKLEKKILDKIQGIENRIEQTISKKLAENQKNIDEKINKVSESYADSVRRSNSTSEPTMDFRQIMRETKNEELVQQRQREARAQNIVIHGFPEENDTQEGNIEADTNTIKELLKIIEVEATPVSIVRLGKRTESKRRPIKIRMSTLNERELMMSSLGKLKVAPEKFKKISITEDYTIEERQVIKNKVEEARNKTEAEGGGNHIWRVRGSPKNGLRLIKFTINKSAGETQNH